MKKKREVLKTIKRENYTIIFSKQENLENDLSDLYRTIGELLYKHATEENKDNKKDNKDV